MNTNAANQSLVDMNAISTRDGLQQDVKYKIKELNIKINQVEGSLSIAIKSLEADLCRASNLLAISKGTGRSRFKSNLVSDKGATIDSLMNQLNHLTSERSGLVQLNNRLSIHHVS